MSSQGPGPKRKRRLPTLDRYGHISRHTPETIDPRPLAVDNKVALTDEFQRALARAAELEDDAWSPETQRAYQSDWIQFERFCARFGRLALPANAKTLRAFVAHQFRIEKKKPATLRRRITAIRMVHDAFRQPWPDVDQRLIKMMKGVRRNHKGPVRKKTAAVESEIRRMADACDSGTNKSIRDRALLLFGYATAMRRSELARVEVEDLEETDKGYKVTVPFSKTDPNAEGQMIAVLARNSEYCPVQAVKDWLTVANIKSGPIFRRFHRFDTISRAAKPMSDRTVANLIKECAAKAGLDPRKYAGHSLRRGFLTSAAETGDDLKRLAAHSRHKKLEMVQEYINEADKFLSPAGEKLLRDDEPAA